MQRNLNLELVVSKYIEFKKDDGKFSKHMQREAEKIAKDRANNSVPDDKQPEVS